MNPLELVSYYAGLLILQYAGKPKAVATIGALVAPLLMPQTTVQTIEFGAAAASGAFELEWDGSTSAAINWNDSASTIQGKIQAITGLSTVTSTGTVSTGITVTFTGVIPPAALFTVPSNTLETSGSAAVSITIAQTDEILPLAVANAFNLATAVGAQLDILGKYAGVTRYGNTFTGPVTLTDTQFRTVIYACIAYNTLGKSPTLNGQTSFGSSLFTIQQFLAAYWPGVIQVFDHLTMRISYFYLAQIGTNVPAEFFINLGLLPRPLGVGSSTLTYAWPTNNFFGMRTYQFQPPNVAPFNSYSSYQSGRPWLSYKNGLST